MERILLVNDHEHARPMIGNILELGAYDLLDAGGANETVAVGAAHAEPIHLLLTGVMMPGLMGSEPARRLRPPRPRMKERCTPAFTLVDVENRTIDLDPGAPILAKPFSVDRLLGPADRGSSEPATTRPLTGAIVAETHT